MPPKIDAVNFHPKQSTTKNCLTNYNFPWSETHQTISQPNKTHYASAVVLLHTLNSPPSRSEVVLSLNRLLVCTDTYRC
ncbi:hypothetical protein NC653_003008 [Populus alba x Populus x berolinensis]|uniref:Uncharacterized protein n=1 Tax=Populus alba x Populus x berolinensis TaxID=444605 RepID=A0AAD6RQG7_9ROSI|nr:hypothetical protein NC653_003008 [Populus alba x Populus x berolinensis]